jgi:hypothetical protein
MPYISQAERRILEEGGTVATAGMLNYAFTLCIKDYMEHHPVNYQTINDIVGALEGAKLEFYRRVVADYEDGKIESNGDVY